MKYKLEAACGCDIGYVRDNNEDNFYFGGKTLPQSNWGMKNSLFLQRHSVKYGDVFGVFDGMGGAEDGQIASYLAANVCKRYCTGLKNRFLSPEIFMKNLLLYMNEFVCKKAGGIQRHMGTTAAVLRFCDEEIVSCNVGDTKVFCFRQNQLFQISKDHTDAEFLGEHGVLNRKPTLSQYIGIPPEEMRIVPYVTKQKICVGDQYLICSDGLTNMVTNAEILSILKKELLVSETVEKLVSTALEYGGRDNITVIVVKIV